MNPSRERIEAFKQEVIQLSSNSDFIHHIWFVEYHLDVVDKIASELLGFYPDANPELVKVLTWIHDYGKAIDFDNQYELTLTKGRTKLTELGFEDQFIDKVIEYAAILDKKLEVNLSHAPIEVQIVSSADGCSHLAGPFMQLWLYENPSKSIKELLRGNYNKAVKDWTYKIVLPEARVAFEDRYKLILEQSGEIPSKFFEIAS